MSVQSDLVEIKTAFETAEADLKRAMRSQRRLHNLCAAKMMEHADTLGLSDEDIIVMGGGTPKEEED